MVKDVVAKTKASFNRKRFLFKYFFMKICIASRAYTSYGPVTHVTRERERAEKASFFGCQYFGINSLKLENFEEFSENCRESIPAYHALAPNN